MVDNYGGNQAIFPGRGHPEIFHHSDNNKLPRISKKLPIIFWLLLAEK